MMGQTLPPLVQNAFAQLGVVPVEGDNQTAKVRAAVITFRVLIDFAKTPVCADLLADFRAKKIAPQVFFDRVRDRFLEHHTDL